MRIFLDSNSAIKFMGFIALFCKSMVIFYFYEIFILYQSDWHGEFFLNLQNLFLCHTQYLRNVLNRKTLL